MTYMNDVPEALANLMVKSCPAQELTFQKLKCNILSAAKQS